ncbi:MAG: LamG-like jellyroll fold domain-containing protein, partial [Nitrososphaeraceae archaeon]
LININNIDVIYAQTTIPNFNIAAAGDWGCNSNTDKTVNSIKNQSPELILGLGDYSYESSADCWLEALKPIYDHENPNPPNRDKMQISIGNHENSGSEDLNTYINAFSLTKQFGQVYSFNLQNVHFISMATEISYSSSSSQKAFVEQDLKAASTNQNIDWIIVYFHKPMYSSPSSCSSCSGESSLRDTYHPLFDKYGVDLVLEGHTHDYQRSYPIAFNSNSKSTPIIKDTNKNTYSDPAGQIYSLVGTGGVNFHSLKTPLKSYLVYGQSKEFGFLNIDIQNNGQTLVGKFLSNDRSPSSPLDQFTITKSGSSPPTSPEICRDGIDNNGNGQTDENCTEICSDGIDNNGNGQTDENCPPPSSGYHYAPFLTINDASDIIDTQDRPDLRLSKFSVAAWFKTTTVPDDDDDYGFIANKGGSGTDSTGKNQNYGLWITTSGKLSGGYETSSGSNKYVTSDKSYVDGQWHHGVVTFDGSNVRLYVDGIQVKSTSTTSLPDKSGNQPLRIGANSLSVRDIFVGDIDEVGVWSKALATSEITKLMNENIIPAGKVFPP